MDNKIVLVPSSAAVDPDRRRAPLAGDSTTWVRPGGRSGYSGLEAHGPHVSHSTREQVAGFLAPSMLGGQGVDVELLSSREELRDFSELLILIQENERRRIALDLHDGLGQSLSLIKLSIEHSARLLAEGATAEAKQALQQLLPRVREALAEVRRVSTELRPPVLDDLGILATISWLAREFSCVARGLQVETSLNVAENEVPAHLHITIFRIVQEAFHNVAKHSEACRVLVRLERADAVLHLWIEDDGRGFDPLMVRREGHGRGLGLVSMRERASLTGGSYRLESACGRGTSIRASWPCHTDD